MGILHIEFYVEFVIFWNTYRFTYKMKIEIGDRFLRTGVDIQKVEYHAVVKSIKHGRVHVVSNLDEKHGALLKQEEIEKWIKEGFWIKINSTNN